MCSFVWDIDKWLRGKLDICLGPTINNSLIHDTYCSSVSIKIVSVCACDQSKMKPFIATFKIRQKVGDWFKVKNEDALCIKDSVHTHLQVSESEKHRVFSSVGGRRRYVVRTAVYIIR